MIKRKKTATQVINDMTVRERAEVLKWFMEAYEAHGEGEFKAPIHEPRFCDELYAKINGVWDYRDGSR